MGKETKHLFSALNQLDTDIDVQWGRIGLMQRWLEDHSARIENLSARIDANVARIDALLNKLTSA
jgi:hypothetical protein